MALPIWLLAIFIIVGVVVIALIGIILYFFVFKKKKGYPFILYSRDLQRAKIIQATLRADPTNKENKKFFFQGNDTTLMLREPTYFQDGVAYRQIMQNKDGGYSYIEETKLDESKYIKLSLTPDEKALALHRIKENVERYAQPMSKTTAAMIITGFILVIVLVIGIIYSTVAYVGAGKDVIKVVKATQEMQNAQNSNTNTLALISSQQAQITAALTKENNIQTNLTRQIS